MHSSSQITEGKRTTYVWKGWMEGREVGDRQVSLDGAIPGPESTLEACQQYRLCRAIAGPETGPGSLQVTPSAD